MSISALGSLGTGTDYSTGKTLSVAPVRAVPAGRIVVVWYAQDSVFSIFNPNDGESLCKVHDSQGNVYCTIASQVHKGAFTKSGPLVQIHVARIHNPLSTSDTITVRTPSDLFAGTTWAKAVSIEEFDFGAGLRWALDGRLVSKTLNDNSDPPSISYSAFSVAEGLWLHALGWEGPSTDSFTWDSDYTQITTAGTNTGTATNDMTILGGYRVANLSSDTVDVASNTADRNNAQVMCLLYQMKPRFDFPHTPILDDFNRADENPLSGAGNWETTEKALGSSLAKLVSNTARGSSGAGAGGSFWDDTYASCVEVFADLPAFADVQLHYHATGDSAAATMQGFGVGWVRGTTDPGGTRFDRIKAGISGQEGGVDIGFLAWVDGGDGCSIGAQMTKPRPDLVGGGARGVHNLWAIPSGGSEWIWCGAWVGDETRTGRLALALGHADTHADDFGGGPFQCLSPFKPQIYRRVLGVA